MTKRILCLVAAVLMLAGATTVSANSSEDLPIGYYNIVYANRYVYFSSDGGSYIRPLELPRGTVVNLDEYAPTKDGYIFEGWYSDPCTKEQRVTEVTLDENIVVFAKWGSNGRSEQQVENGVIAREVIGNYVVIQTEDATLVTHVTDLWVQQNAKLEALMQIYNQKFNK